MLITNLKKIPSTSRRGDFHMIKYQLLIKTFCLIKTLNFPITCEVQIHM